MNYSKCQINFPFVMSADSQNTYGRLSRYADPSKREQEKGAYEKAMVEKYEKDEKNASEYY